MRSPSTIYCELHLQTEGKLEAMIETNDDWGAAPKDGSEINVQFPDGSKTRAKWNAQTGQWEVLRHSGEWVSMRYEHGIDDPVVWWPYSMN
jgi:hypothetical protein